MSCPVLKGFFWALSWSPLTRLSLNRLSEPVTQGPKLCQALRDTSCSRGRGSVGVVHGCARMVALSNLYHCCWLGPCLAEAESQHSPSNFTVATPTSSLSPTAGDGDCPVTSMSSLFASQAVLFQQWKERVPLICLLTMQLKSLRLVTCRTASVFCFILSAPFPLLTEYLIIYVEVVQLQQKKDASSVHKSLVGSLLARK